MKKQITIGVGEAATTAKEFIDAWKLAERGETVQDSLICSDHLKRLPDLNAKRLFLNV